MAGDDFKPECVEIKLLAHAAQKGWQAGSLLGTLLGVPIVALRSGGLSVEGATTAAGYGALGGLGLTALLYAGKRCTMDREGVEERVYRLHYNASQNRVDAFTAVGSAVGVAAAAFLLHRGESGGHPPGINLVGGAALGCAAGLAAHMLTRPAEMATPNIMMHELKH